jgi:hypothetical protein
MPQPTLNQVHSPSPLTNIAVAYMQDESAYIADKVFPIVPVSHQSDLYYIWSKADFFRNNPKKRADATESAGSGVNLTQDSYRCDVWALHDDIGEQARANQDPSVDLETTTTEFLMQQLLISRDLNFASTYMTTGVWGTDLVGAATPTGAQVYQWSDDANSDPFTDISNAQTTILQNTGKKPNVLVLGWAVYQALRKHPLVIDRIKFTMQADAADITPALLAGAFAVEEVVVSEAVYNSAAEGQAAAMGFIVGKSALLCYRPKAPGLRIPSAGYIFAWNGLDGMGVFGARSWSEPLPNRGKNSIRVECEMAYGLKRVGADLGYFFSTIVA